MIDLDGSFGEGGGQILRSSLALSLITKKPFRLRNIRARRARPGLQPQHLMSVQAAATIGQGKLRGAVLGTTDLVFEPGETTAGTYHFRIGTAGATSLVLHTVYLPLALAAGPSVVTIEGGTHVKASPCFHFLQTTWRGYLAELGIDLELRMRRPGFYPRGGGLVEARLPGALSSVPEFARIRSFSPAKSNSCEFGLGALDTGTSSPGRGRIDHVKIFSAVSGLPDSIARRQADRASQQLKKNQLNATIHYETWQGSPGTMLAVEIPTRPVPTLFFGLGERGKPAERVADEAVEQVISFLHAQPPGIDAHSADQILLPLSLAPEPSQFQVAQITQHLLTNAAVIMRFLDRKIVCEGEEGSAGTIHIK